VVATRLTTAIEGRRILFRRHPISIMVFAGRVGWRNLPKLGSVPLRGLDPARHVSRASLARYCNPAVVGSHISGRVLSREEIAPNCNIAIC